MAADGSAVQVRFVGAVAEIADPLWHECFPLPREWRSWYQALAGSGLEDQFTFRYAVLERDGRAIAIAPCFLHDVPVAPVAPSPVAWALRPLTKVLPRVGYRRTFFVGSPCADEGTVGLVPGVELKGVAPALTRAVRIQARQLGAPMIVFKDFPEADLPALTGLAGFVRTVSYPGTIVALPGPGKEAYVRSLTHNQRHNLLKKLRRSRELLRLETSVVQRPTDRKLAEIFGLFRQTFERGKTKFERLNLQFFEHVREQAPARFILQREAAPSWRSCWSSSWATA